MFDYNSWGLSTATKGSGFDAKVAVCKKVTVMIEDGRDGLVFKRRMSAGNHKRRARKSSAPASFEFKLSRQPESVETAHGVPTPALSSVPVPT